MTPSTVQPTSTPPPIARRPTIRLVALALGCALLALLPALWLVGVQQQQLALHEQRLRGHEYLAAAAPLAGALPWHRDLSTRLLLGEIAVEGALRRAASEVRSALRRASATLEERGDPFALADDWREVNERWAHLDARYIRLAAAENVEAHNRLLQHVEAFLAQVALRSQLAQDPVAATHLLILCETEDMPAVARHLAMLRAYTLLAGGESGADTREHIARTVLAARAALERLSAHLSAAYAADAVSEALLEQRSTRALSLVHGLLEEVDALLASGRVPQPDVGAWFSTTTQAVESLQGVSDALSERVASLLASEVETLRVRRGATQALAVLFGSCALLAALVLGRALLLRGRPASASDRSEQPEATRQHPGGTAA